MLITTGIFRHCYTVPHSQTLSRGDYEAVTHSCNYCTKVGYKATKLLRDNNNDILYNTGISHKVALMALSWYLFIKHIQNKNSGKYQMDSKHTRVL